MSVEKTWVEKVVDLRAADALSADLKVSPLLAKLLVARRMTERKTAEDFLAPSLKNLKEPLSFAGMATAVERITRSLYDREKIGIFGDYDVDGVCSTAILQQFLESIGADVATTLPNRMLEGYGLSKAGVDRLKATGSTLLITADCGILAHEQVDYANALGFDVIVVDHHTVGVELPKALAVINPKRADCGSGADYLCAAGVVFFLCMALRRNLREQGYFSQAAEPDVRELLDLVALATVCDVVPLVKDNRSMVKAGLKVIKHGDRIGLSALMDASGIDRQKISSTNLGFHLGPRINAAGRLEDATSALRLLFAVDQATAKRLAMDLDITNQERKTIEQDTVEKASAIIEADPQYRALPAFVLHREEWHPGVVGIVASRIAERYHRPAIIIGEKGKGSGRSIKGIDLHEMVLRASRSLLGFGGHAHAIGVTLGPLGVDVFRNELLAVLTEHVPTRVFNKEVVYDAELCLSEVSLVAIDELMRLEPFGAHNPYPVFRINRCFMRNLRRLSGGHIKGELENASGNMTFIGFRMDIDDGLAHHAIDVLGVMEKNEWQGRVSPQLRLIDYKKSPS